MKKNKLTTPFVLFTCAVLALSSCKKEDPVPEAETPPIPEPTVISNDFSAVVDGDEFFETSFTCTKNDTMLLFSASKGGGKSIGLVMPITIGEGTFAFEGMLGKKIGTYVTPATPAANGQYVVSPGGGELKIIFHDKNQNIIRGTFYYTASPIPTSTATDSHNITSGTFTYNY